MVVPTQLTAEAVNQLREGINLLLGRWSALQMAIQNEWGGRDTRQKAQQLAVDIYHWFIRPSETLYVDDLENLLDDFMLSLNTEIDDGSIEEISDNLMIMHEECLEGNFVSIERLRQSIPAANQCMQVVKGGEDSTSEDESIEIAEDESMEIAEDESMEIAEDELKEIAEDKSKEIAEDESKEIEDGWTKVSSRRNRGGKH